MTPEVELSQRPLACHRYRKSPAAVVAPSSVMSRDYHKMFLHTRSSTAGSTCLSADHPTTSGNAARADRESDGSTRSERTMGSPRRTYGGARLLVVTEEQRYGPRWLRDNDDNENYNEELAGDVNWNSPDRIQTSSMVPVASASAKVTALHPSRDVPATIIDGLSKLGLLTSYSPTPRGPTLETTMSKPRPQEKCCGIPMA